MIEVVHQMRRLVEGLYIRTAEESIDWTYSESLSMCQADIGDGLVRVFEEMSGDGNLIYYISIVNGLSQTMDRIFPEAFNDSFGPTNTNHRTYDDLFKDLFLSAKRHASGVSALISSMVDAIGVSDLEINDEAPF